MKSKLCAVIDAFIVGSLKARKSCLWTDEMNAQPKRKRITHPTYHCSVDVCFDAIAEECARG